jgi:DNA-binding transcriptional MocR family regulator
LTLGEAGRRELAGIARAGRMTLVVDESMAEIVLDGEPMPPMAAFGPAISIGSASKLFWGGLRVGWVRADEATITRLATARAPLDLGVPPLEQLAVALLLEQADPLIAERTAQLRGRRAALTDALRAQLPDWRWLPGVGGMSLWVQLPRPVSSRLSAVAVEFGVVTTAGPRFGINGAFEQWARLPYVHEPDRLRAAVAGLAGAYRAVTAGAGVRPEPSVMV